MTAEFLKLENFSCGYGNAFTVGDVNITLTKGSFAGIIGPNGSGKTTLFRGISGALPAKSGKLFLNGTDISHINRKDKARRVSVVAQFSETTDVSVEEYVLMGRIPYRKPFQFLDSTDDLKIAKYYMTMTGILQHRHNSIQQLSGGEQQLAAIAQALTQQPELLLLDEPTSHLDITHQIKILNLIQYLNQKNNLTVLMIIHDLNLASEYCDYLLMMNQGKVHTQGTPQQVLSFENIEKVYNTVVVTQNNPLSGKPAIFLVSDQILRQQKKTAATG